MSKIFYARVSSKGQNLSRQLDEAKKLHIRKKNIYKEKVSGATISKRPQIQRLLYNIKKGDVVYVLALDRLGRNAKEIKQIMSEIKAKGATLDALNLPSLKDIKNSNLRALLDDLIIDIYTYEAEQERKDIKTRQRQGIEQAKKNNKYKGRQRHFYLNSPDVKKALSQYFNKSVNKLSTVQIARLNNISISELYKLIRLYKSKHHMLQTNIYNYIDKNKKKN